MSDIVYEGAFLQCDTKGCDHIEKTPDYGPQYIGMPCPKCGANLLTQEDFDAAQPMYAAIEILKKMGLVGGEIEQGKEYTALSLGHHNGKTKIEMENLPSHSTATESAEK